MKQVINLKIILNSLKHIMYAVMVLALAVSIPLLSYMELAHTDKQEERATTSFKETSGVAKQITIVNLDKQPS